MHEAFGEFFAFVNRHGGPPSIRVAINGVTFALANMSKSIFSKARIISGGFNGLILDMNFDLVNGRLKWDWLAQLSPRGNVNGDSVF